MNDLEAIERAIAGIDFDSVFEIKANGEIVRGLDLDGPTVYHDETDDIDVEQYVGHHWEALTGYTGQYGYNGAVMHASEYVGGGLLRDMIDNPGIYVMTVVEVMPEDDDDEPEPAGWAVFRWEDPNA